MMKNNFLTLVFSALSVMLTAQVPLNNYFMEYNPYSFYVNPGKAPNMKAYVGIPGIGYSNYHLSNSGFAFKDVVDYDTFKPNDLLDVVSDRNNFEFAYQFSAASFGFSIDSVNYFSFNFSPKANFDLAYSKTFLEFFILGPGNDKFIGNTLYFDGTGLNNNLYSELALGYNRGINKRLSVGGNVKLLSGVAGMRSSLDGVGIYTDPDDYSLTLKSDFELMIHGVSTVGTGDFGLPTDLGNVEYNYFKNFGLAFDFGANYKLNDKLELSANVIDLGGITWRDGNRWYNDGAEFTFEGVDWDDYNDDNFFENLSDSLIDIFNLKKDSNYAYTSYLPTRIILGGKYKINKFLAADALYSGRIINESMRSSLIIGGNFQLAKILTARLSYGIINRSFTNVGAGINLNLGAFQLFASADNTFGFTQIDYARTLNLSLGMAVLIGKGKRYANNTVKTTENDEE